MGQLLDLGIQAGKAAPGDRSPDALLTTAGQVLMRDPTTGIIGLKYPPGYLLASDAGATITSAVVGSTETTVLAGGDIAGVFPASVAVGDMVRVKAAGSWINNTGAGQTLTINLYMAATLIAGYTGPSFAASAQQHNWQLDIEVDASIIGGAGVGAVKPSGVLWVAMGGGTGFTVPTAFTDFAINDGAPITIATNAAATGNVKAKLSTATSGASVVCNKFNARLFAKNY